MYRIDLSLVAQIETIYESLNKNRPNGKKLSKVEVSRFIADYLQTNHIEASITKLEAYKPNGNRYGLKIISKFPGDGFSL
jgi:hypothetical protein